MTTARVARRRSRGRDCASIRHRVGPTNQALYYLLAWESLAEREKKWAAFASDPEWLAKRAETEKDGPIITHFENMILQPTAFSSVK